MLAEIVSDYAKIENNVDKLIEISGYKLSHVYESLGLDRTSFYYKRKNKKFTTSEIAKLLSIIDIDKIEDKVLYQMSLEGEASGIMSEKEKMNG